MSVLCRRTNCVHVNTVDVTNDLRFFLEPPSLLLLLLLQISSPSPLSRADEYRRSINERAEEDLDDSEKGDEGISDDGSRDVGINEDDGGGEVSSFGTPPPLSSSSTTEEVAMVVNAAVAEV